MDNLQESRLREYEQARSVSIGMNINDLGTIAAGMGDPNSREGMCQGPDCRRLSGAGGGARSMPGPAASAAGSVRRPPPMFSQTMSSGPRCSGQRRQMIETGN